MSLATLELRSLITAEGELRLTLEGVPISAPGPDEVVVRVDASPVNPSDLSTLLGPADVDTIGVGGSATRPVITAKIPPQAASLVAARVGKSLPVGHEGAGVVIDAGAEARHLLGKTVAMSGGAMYSSHRKLRAAEVFPLPGGVTAQQGAAAFVNPLSALGMVSTMRREGYKALVHTAAASNLGQMLNRLCLAECVALVNIVRSEAQVEILKAAGAAHVLNSSAPGFHDRLVAAIEATGATLAFDAVGGGALAGQILTAMEAALVARDQPTTLYGSWVRKQVYVYGRLDPSPALLPASLGVAWNIGGWLVSQHLAEIGQGAAHALRERAVSEVATTFASRYTRELSLVEALDPAVLRACRRHATGEKFLLLPSKDQGVSA